MCNVALIFLGLTRFLLVGMLQGCVLFVPIAASELLRLRSWIIITTYPFSSMAFGKRKIPSASWRSPEPMTCSKRWQRDGLDGFAIRHGRLKVRDVPKEGYKRYQIATRLLVIESQKLENPKKEEKTKGFSK